MLTGFIAAAPVGNATASNTPETPAIGPEAPTRVILSSEHAVTAERIAALPAEERPAWERYLARSVERRRAEQAVLDAEVQAQGLAAPQLAPEGKDFKLPSHPTASWFASDEARRLVATVLSFQTPSGGWSKAVRFDCGRRDC